MSTTTAHGAGDAGAPVATPRPVLLDAAATTRCRRRVHLEHVPVEDLVTGPPGDEDADPGVAMRRADATAHRKALAARWAELLGARWTAVPPAGGSAARAAATLAVLAEAGPGVDVVGGAELPAAEGRRGGAEVLVRAVPGDPASGWWPLIVVRHRVTDPGGGALTSPLAQPHPLAAVPDETRRVRTVTRDVLRLAHLHRMLRAAGLAPPEEPDAPVWGGLVGLDADAVVWLDLATPSGPGGRSVLETYDRRHTDRLAVAEAARARAPALAEPSRITECRRCPWWPTCEAALRAVDDVSLVVRGDAALRLRGQGITTVRELAAVDPAVGLPGPEPDEGDDVADPVPDAPDLVEAVALARAWRGDIPLVRRVARPTVARGDVELDVDMESLGEDGAYLWGVLLSGADIGLEPGYRAFATWDPLPTRDEGRSFGEFWTWLSDVRARCAARGLELRAYCYNEQAENRWLRASAERFAGMPGVPPTAEVEEFIASEAWIDLFPVVSDSFLCPHGKGLKRVAPSAGFAWHDAEAGGENSMRWYREAVGLDGGEPDPAQRERLLVYNADDVRATWTLRTWLTSPRVLEVPHIDDL